VKDEEIEALLSRYRPIARTGELRLTPAPRTWPWAVAAAALLAITIGLHAGVSPAPEPPLDQARVQAIADQLGGGPMARTLAESMVDVAEARDAARAEGSTMGMVR